jgi:excisionase family DNA binding protein
LWYLIGYPEILEAKYNYVIFLTTKYISIRIKKLYNMDSPIVKNAPLLNITEAAVYLNVSKATIRRWTDDGRLACLRLGARNERRFLEVDLRELITEPKSNQQVPATSEYMSRSVLGSNSGHQCIVSNTTDEEWASLAPAILTALQEGAQVLIVEVSDRRKRLEELLKAQGLSAPKLLESHALECVSIEESYFLSGEFHWDRAVAFVESAILTAKARGFEKVLIIGADSGQADSIGQGYAEEMKKYELALDDMLSRHPRATVLCPYTASEISAQLMIQGFLTHPQMCINRTPIRGFLGQVAI